MRESAAAWGAALNLIPTLGPVIEGYIKQSEEGRRLSKAIKDPQQQEFFIQAWQQSSVFKAFFPEEAAASAAADGHSVEGEPSTTQATAVPPSLTSHESPGVKPEPALLQHAPTPSPSNEGGRTGFRVAFPEKGPSATTLSDIVAKDAARTSHNFSQTLGSLGFAPDETLDDFLAMSFNPEPLEENQDLDLSLGSEIDQKAYYELLMGKQFG